MAITEIYVDPEIDTNSGSGTIGDPFGRLRYGIEQTTFDTTNGTRVNIKDSAPVVLEEPIDDSMADTGTSIAWDTGLAAPAVFQGYTAAAADGGKATIDTNGQLCFGDTTATGDYIAWIDLEIHGGGASNLFNTNNSNLWYRCEIYDCLSAILGDNYCTVLDCFIYDFDTYGIQVGLGSNIVGNTINCNGDTPTAAIQAISNGGYYTRNIIYGITGATDGIQLRSEGAAVGNSIHATAGTGNGISAAGNSHNKMLVDNNLIEGFSGSGGHAIALLDGFTGNSAIVRGNSHFNCETGIENADIYTLLSGNEALTVSPFNDAANLDFSPVDTGSIKEGALPANFGDGAI